ncbi:Acetyltransferase involved in MEL production [Mycosarcoma maydis]|uniref:Acetyltransferase MATC1 n=1 Tax=Mycosarcoma maydis TaxID=5270 RepID=MAT1_MYCMD|nr:Acetyltransferase involved in MEL production [Ustilago maydis 521]A0A0D1CRC9.1 RecName: Full=Acetyltransferase MATC1; AltName: Full=Mannosylerythritol lipids (MELs) biosynthesis cluster protein MAT1 [Ustilago maydis 521]KIS69143.1 Acetyltransferase involved in MEL production [Ustilago maydis 521]|eukprot:XP_011389465.1 Acetyltransferase involved in MEL production [Ustilago maydis 521]
MKSNVDTVLDGYTSVPVGVLDSTLANTDILTRITLVFPSSLSLSALQESWYALVRSWPILAARVRATPSTPSGLSYLIPTPATLESLETRSRNSASKPLEKHIVLLDQSSRSFSDYHPIVAKAVHSNLDRNNISIGGAPLVEHEKATICSNACTSWKQLIKQDQAFVTAQATKFADATTVTISFSHILGDAFTIKHIFQGWQTALNGQAVQELQDVGKDPFIKYLPKDTNDKKHKKNKKSEPAPDLPLQWFRYGLARKIKLISLLLWEVKVKKPEKTLGQYYIYLPQAKVDELMAQARSDLEQLRSSSATSATERDLNVSTFNVLFAWLLQNIHASTAIKPSKTSSVICIINAKTRPPAGHVPADYPRHQLWGGALGAPLRPLSAAEYVTLPLGQLALHIRESITEQVDPENIRKSVVMALKHSMWKKPSGELLFFSQNPNTYWCGCTEWRSAKFHTIDFSAAATPHHDAIQPTAAPAASVNPVAITTNMETPMTKRNRWALLGEANNGIWFTGGLTANEASNKNGFGRYIFVE